MAGGGGFKGLTAFNRYLKQDGGWAGILERVANAESIEAIAAAIRPGFQAWCKAQGIVVPPTMPSRPWLNIQLRHKRMREAYTEAQQLSADVWQEKAQFNAENATADRDVINLAKLRVDFAMRMAAIRNRAVYGETPASGPTTNIVSLGTLHLQAVSDPGLIKQAKAALETRLAAERERKALPASTSERE